MMPRSPEPELMDLPEEVRAYALADFAEVNRLFVQRLTELATGSVDPSGERSIEAIDLGCGPGDIARRLAIARPNWRILAADASQPMLDWAAQVFTHANVGDRVTGQRVDAKATGLADACFDVVYSNSLLHHLTDANAMWREVRRIIRPGGLVFFRDLYRPHDPAAAEHIVRTHAGGESNLLQDEFYRSLLSAYSIDEIVTQLTASGLGGLQVQAVTDRHVDIWGTIRAG